MLVTDKNGKTEEINKGDKIIITLYDFQNKPITTMNSEAYKPHEVIEQSWQLGVIWGDREEFTPLSSFWATFEKIYDARSRKQYAEQARKKAIEQLVGFGYDRKTAEQSFDSMTERYAKDFKSVDEYSPIIRNANESLYNCGMIDDIITA